MSNSLPTPLDLIKNLIADFERIELHERDKERLTQIASSYRAAKRRDRAFTLRASKSGPTGYESVPA